MLRHGIQREVFFCALASNAAKILQTGKGRPNLSSLLSAAEIAELAVNRWMLPRAERRPEFREWSSANLIELFGNQTRMLRSSIESAGRGKRKLAGV
jgi:hypothetical protein